MGSLVKRLAPLLAAGTISLLSLVGCPVTPDPNPYVPPTPSGTVPEQPSLSIYPVAVEPDRINQILIYDHSDNEDGFTLERKTGNGSFVNLADLSPNAELYDDSGVATSTSYTYRIKAYNESGSSDWDEETATSVGIQTGSVSTQVIADAMVRQLNLNTNYNDTYNEVSGISPYLWSGDFGDPSRANVLLSFPLPTLPSYAIDLEGAYLVTYDAGGGNGSYNIPINIYGALNLNSWNEKTVTWSTRPGALLAEGGFPLAQVIKYADDSYNHVHYISMDVSKIVSYWYENKWPNYGANYGLSLYAGSDSTHWDFYSKESYQPGSASLEVDYTW
jgi:hypothetical protein